MMKNYTVVLCCFITIVLNYAPSTYALKGPTWLFTVPTAKTLEESEFTVGWIFADIGFTNKLEVGIHGIKYNLEPVSKERTGIAFGVAFFEGAYVVGSRRAENVRMHIGVKAAPSFLFFAAEVLMSAHNRVIFEINDGFNIGVRHRIKRRLRLDVGVSYSNFSVYNTQSYEDFPRGYYRRSLREFRFRPIIGLAYSDVF